MTNNTIDAQSIKLNKAVFLDRDGTINNEKHYLYRIEDFEFLPGVIQGLRLLQDAGYLLVIVTNQSGIGRGYYTEKDFTILTEWMISELQCQGIIISKVYYCPHLPDAKVEKYRRDCLCRKPSLGLYEQAVDELDIDLSKSYAIGDKIRDCSISLQHNECKSYLIGNSERENVIAAVLAGCYSSVAYAKDLYEAAKLIIGINKE